MRFRETFYKRTPQLYSITLKEDACVSFNSVDHREILAGLHDGTYRWGSLEVSLKGTTYNTPIWIISPYKEETNEWGEVSL